MKIIEIIPQLSSGGAERFVVDLCNSLSKYNEVILLLLHPLDNNNFYLNEVSLNVRVVSLNKKKGFDASLYIKLYKFIKSERPDIVHTHLRALVYLPLACLSCDKVRYFHTVHSDAKKEAGDFMSTIIRKILFKTRLVTPIAISPESFQSFKSFYNIDIPMIFNGRNVPTNIQISAEVSKEFGLFRKTPKTRILVNLARIDPVKRQTMLAKIASGLSKEGYDFTLLMIGSTKKVELVQEIESYQCPDIKILGEKKNPLEYLSMADAYCLCSSYEGMPISLIEALGTGCIPICTPVGGITDVVQNGDNGILSENLEEESYYCALKHFLDLNDAEIAKMQTRAIESYQAYTMDECANKYVTLFKSQL